MRRYVKALFGGTLLSIWCASTLAQAPTSQGDASAITVPILYSTDLFHPYDDPDDHFDLATLFATKEFDIRGIVLDLGDRQKHKTGRPAVEQMMHITGRRVPIAIGLGTPLRSRTDDARDQPEEFQAAVNLILETLRKSGEKVTIFTTGSCRDVAAAFNREPGLMKRKVKAVYTNVGNGPQGKQDEHNVKPDPQAYARLIESGLPLYWCPCFGADGYQTHYRADQAEVVAACRPAARNFFAYALSRSKADPIAFLASEPPRPPAGERSMWCTAPLLHAAGRSIYERGKDDFAALPRPEGHKAGKEVVVFEFVPMTASVDKDAKVLKTELRPAQPTGFVFRVADGRRYNPVLNSCLKNLLAGLGR